MPAGFENGIAELHHFSDASAVGYGACSYLHVVAPDGQINVSLIASKGHLAPLKAITIPRLELTAAVTAVQLDILIRSPLDIECMPSTFWTDSKIVLAYICSEHKRFKVFVANRVSEIRRCTSVDQWRHINGDNNPADVVSRGCGVYDVPQVWCKGPEFLSQFKCDWPVDDDLHPNKSLDDDPDLHSSSRDNITAGVHTVKTATPLSTHVHPVDAILDHYSSYYKARKALCWLWRVLSFLSGKHVKNEPITVSEMRDAEIVILKRAQNDVYADEICDL